MYVVAGGMVLCGGMERNKQCKQVADVKGPFLRFLYLLFAR